MTGGAQAASMGGIVVTGHGAFASGIVSAIETILGAQEGLVAVDFPQGDDVEGLRGRLADAVRTASASGPATIFCDLRGGSPANVAWSEHRGHAAILVGTNVPMLLEVMSRRMVGAPSTAREIVESGAAHVEQLEAPPPEAVDDWS